MENLFKYFSALSIRNKIIGIYIPKFFLKLHTLFNTKYVVTQAKYHFIALFY